MNRENLIHALMPHYVCMYVWLN